MPTVVMRPSGRGVGSDPAALDNELCRFDTNGGQKIQRCANVLVDDAGNMTAAAFYGATYDTNVAAAGVTLSGVTLSADGTDANIDINITPKGAGAINMPKVDIDAGTINGCDVTVGAGKTLDVSGGTLTLANDQISGDKVEGGTIAGITVADLIVSTSLSVTGSSVFQNTANSTTAYQWLDANGGTPILNIDTTNERVGIGTNAPIVPLHVAGFGAFGADVSTLGDTNNGHVDRALNVIDPEAVLKIWRYTADANKSPGIEIVWGTGATDDAAGNYYWDMYIQAYNGGLYLRDRSNGQGNVNRLGILSNGNIGFGDDTPETAIELTNPAPYMTFHNSTHEDTDGGRESIIWFSGEQSGGEETHLAAIRAQHGGAADDQKGELILYTNDGTDGDAPTEQVRIASDGIVTTTGVVRGATSLWWHSIHAEIASINPGASGATWISDDADTAGGWRLNANTEILEVRSDVHSDWDGASDIEIKIVYEVNVDNTAGLVTDTVDFKVVAHYKGTGDVACKIQTQEEACVVGQSAQYKQFTCTINLNWDETDNVIEAGDKITFQINLETDTSEVDDVIVNHVHTRHKSAQIRPEV